MPVIVVPCSPQWPADFQAIKANVTTALQGVEVTSIEYVGSTSVPDLSAKPIIDIDVIVAGETVPDAIGALVEKGGYTYLGERGILDRHAFRTPSSARPERSLYVCVRKCAALRNVLGVRDVLRVDGTLREEYARVKVELAERGLGIDEYVEGKSEVLQRILEKTGMGELEREAIRRLNRSVEGGGMLGSEKMAI